MTDPVCIECDKKTQKDLPANDNLSSKDMSCEKEYSEVTSCMNRYEGQISSYTDQWNSFRLCHDKQKRSQWRSSVCVCVCEVIWSNVIFPSAQKWSMSIGLKLVWITIYIFMSMDYCAKIINRPKASTSSCRTVPGTVCFRLKTLRVLYLLKGVV